MGVLADVLRCWTAEPKGRILLIGWAATFAGVTIRAVVLQRRRKKQLTLVKKQPSTISSTETKSSPAKALTPLRRMQRLAVPKWSSKPVVWCALLTTGIGLRLVVQVKTSAEVGALGSLLSKQDWPALYRRQLSYALYAVPAAVFYALQKLAAANAALAMRENLTAALHERYEQAGSLPAALASVEAVAGGDEGVQRGMADLDAYCVNSVALFEALIKPSTEVILISIKLATMMGGRQLLSIATFFGAAGSWARMVAPGFATMQADVQAAEGALLSHRARLHAYAEEVTMLQGAPAERQLMDRAASVHTRASRTLSLQRFGSDVLDTYVLRHLGILAAFIAMMPAIIQGASGSAALKDPTEYFLTCLHLLVQVGMALRDLVLSHKNLATTRGLAGRVHELLEALEQKAAAAPALELASAPTACSDTVAPPLLLQLSGVRVSTPAGRELLSGVTLEVRAGMRVLVSGPNGAGKSALFRVLTGVWPLGDADADGALSWYVPPASRLVLPQRSYTLPQLSLKANLAYPDVDAAGESTLVGGLPSDDELLALFHRVGLHQLVPNGIADLGRAHGADGLSAGEKQRLALARLLLRKPAIAILDEPCSAVEPDFELAFFAECAAAGMSMVTAAHRTQLAQFHTHELRLDGQGRATLRELHGSEASDES
jgi:ABC-type branched-subunit amino acid transport system ATPase component